MSIDDIYNELVKAGHPTSLTSDVGTLSLRTCVHNYIKTELSQSGSIFEYQKGLIYLPQLVFTNLTECGNYVSRLTDADPVSYVYHIKKLHKLLKSEPNIIIWAKSNRQDIDPEIRYYSYLLLISTQNTSKYITEALSDTNFRVNCLAVFSVPGSTKVNLRKVTSLLSDDSYAGLISSISFPNEMFLKAYTKLIKSDDREMVNIGLRGLRNDRRVESLPGLIRVFEDMDAEFSLTIFSGQYMDGYEKHIDQLSSQQGRLPDEVRKQLLELCESENPTTQRLSFIAMRSKWVKSDLDALENIETKSNPAATKLKLEALYKKKSQNRFSIANSHLNSTQEGLRNAAVEVIGDYGSDSELKILLSILKTETDRNEYNYDTATLLEAIKKLQG